MNEDQTIKMTDFAFQILGMIADVIKGQGGTAYQLADVTIEDQTHKLAVIVMSGVNAAVIEDLVKAKISAGPDQMDKLLEKFEGTPQ